MEANDFETANSFELSLDKLYLRLFWVSMIGGALTLFSQLFAYRLADIVLTIAFWICSLISYFIYHNYDKKIAFHTLIIPLSLIFVYMVGFQAKNYLAIFLLYPVIIILSFIFVDKFSVLVAYLIFIISCQLAIMWFLKIRLSEDFFAEMIGESLNIIAYNVVAFLTCHFYLSNLKDYKRSLDDSIRNVEAQKLELAEKNEKMTKYIESNLQLENFASLAAHELKAPLRNTQNFLSLLERSAKDKFSDSEKDLFKVVSQNNAKMNLLVGALHELGSVTDTDWNLEQVSIKKIIAEITLERDDQINEKQASIHYEGPEISIEGERILLSQLFSNLIGNALKFVEQGVKPKISIKASIEQENCHFMISDNGIGIPKEYHGKIFQLFERLHAESEYKGSGIGLAICKKIVDLHHGIIWVEENPTGGSIFCIRLPKEQIPFK